MIIAEKFKIRRSRTKTKRLLIYCYDVFLLNSITSIRRESVVE